MSASRSILRDSSGASNVISSTRSSRSRRKSFCVSDRVSNREETPNKGNDNSDRLALLQKWRMEKEGKENSSGSILKSKPIPASTELETKKRTRQYDAPPLPPSASSTAYSSTFLSQESHPPRDRSRQRKQPKLAEDSPQATPTISSVRCTIDYFDEDDNISSTSKLAARSPLLRRSLGGARRRSLSTSARRGRASKMQSMSQESDDSFGSARSTRRAPSAYSQQMSDVEETTEEKITNLSRMKQMQKRIEQLEQEKTDLVMAKIPLENRLREQEELWKKECTRLLTEIEASTQQARKADDRCRALEMQYEEKEIECKKLKMEVQKASRSTHSSSNQNDTGSWSVQIQNDRDVAELRAKLRHSEEEIGALKLAKASVESELHGTEIELEALQRTHDELQEEHAEVVASRSDNKDAEIMLETLKTTHIATSAQLNAVREDLAATKARAEAKMEAKEEEHRKEIEKLKFDMSVLKTRAGRVADNDISFVEDEEDEAVLRARIEERDRRISELEAEVLKGEQLRRQMHNRIQELRGNIRVFVRTRPFLPGDNQTSGSSIDVSPDGESLSITDMRNGNPHDFTFDKVFAPSAGQEDVFHEVSDFVQSALDGYNVCLFSYGQTGSGKTHTMQGSGNGVMRGIIPRAVEQILDQTRVSRAQKWEVTMTASFLEIYNEELKDLLLSMKKGKSRGEKKLSIKRTKAGKSYVDGLSEISIETEDSAEGMRQLDALMAVAARSRSVASTKMNAQSSRSHSVFMLHLRGYNKDNGATMEGSLNLCDLAGSERLDRSGAATDAKRLRETQAINKSLSCLGDVFTALAQRSTHVPYRNSKLTYLLQDCLSGDGKAMMFVNLSPTTASTGESLCSLRFATRVNTVELGKARKHIQYNR